MSESKFKKFCNKIYDGKITDIELTEQLNSEFIQMRDGLECTILHHSALFARPVLMALAIREGADINATDWHSSTPLHLACSCGHEECVEILLVQGADITMIDYNGETCIDKAKQKNHHSIVRKIEDHQQRLLNEIPIASQENGNKNSSVKEVDRLKKESKKFKNDSIQSQTDLDNFKSEVDNLKNNINIYKNESNIQSEKYKLEIDNLKKELEIYKKESVEFQNELRIKYRDLELQKNEVSIVTEENRALYQHFKMKFKYEFLTKVQGLQSEMIKLSMEQDNLRHIVDSQMHLCNSEESISLCSQHLLSDLQQSQSEYQRNFDNFVAETASNRLDADRLIKDLVKKIQSIEDEQNLQQEIQSQKLNALEYIKEQIIDLNSDNLNSKNELMYKTQRLQEEIDYIKNIEKKVDQQISKNEGRQNSLLKQNQPDQKIVSSDDTRWIVHLLIAMFYVLLIYRGQYYVFTLCILLMSAFVLYFSLYLTRH